MIPFLRALPGRAIRAIRKIHYPRNSHTSLPSEPSLDELDSDSIILPMPILPGYPTTPAHVAYSLTSAATVEQGAYEIRVQLSVSNETDYPITMNKMFPYLDLTEAFIVGSLKVTDVDTGIQEHSSIICREREIPYLNMESIETFVTISPRDTWTTEPSFLNVYWKPGHTYSVRLAEVCKQWWAYGSTEEVIKQGERETERRRNVQNSVCYDRRVASASGIQPLEVTSLGKTIYLVIPGIKMCDGGEEKVGELSDFKIE